MEKAESVITLGTPVPGIPVYQNRQTLILKIALDSVTRGCSESEALGMLFWRLADLGAPVNSKEQLLLCAFFRMHESCRNTRIECCQRALELLEIAPEDFHLPPKDLVKKAKAAYWKEFNELSRNLKSFLSNASRIGRKKKALSFICNYGVITGETETR